MNPKLFYPRFYLLELLIKENKRAEAKAEAQKIILLPEKIPTKESKQIKTVALQYLNSK